MSNLRKGMVGRAKWAEGSPMWKRANTMKTNLWEQLKDCADADKNDQISLDEWIDFWAECAVNYKEDKDLPFWYTEFLDVYFSFMDINGDGWIDGAEFVDYFHGFRNIDAGVVEIAYKKITSNGRKNLDLKLFREMCIGYTVSQDMKSPGNIMGEMLVKQIGCDTEFKRTEFWDRKQRHQFYYWFDQDRNGVAEKNDFDLHAENIIALTKWTEGSPMWVKCKDMFDTMWTEMRRGADANSDDKVTIDEWLTFMENMCRQIQTKKIKVPSWYGNFLDIWFDVLDGLGNGDGWVTVDEWVSVGKVHKIPADVSAKAFQEITYDGRIPMDRDYLNLVLLQFNISTDMNSPGNIHARMLFHIDEHFQKTEPTQKI